MDDPADRPAIVHPARPGWFDGNSGSIAAQALSDNQKPADITTPLFHS